MPWAKSQSNYYPNLLAAVAERLGFALETPLNRLTEEQWHGLVYGTDGPVRFHYINVFDQAKVYNAPFEGLLAYFERRYKESSSDYVRQEIETFMSERPCPVCHGKRLRPEALAVKMGDFDRRVYPDDGAGRAEFLEACSCPKGTADCPADFERDPGAFRVSDQCRAGLPDPGPGRRDLIRRGSAADQAGDPNRLQPHRGTLCFG